MYPVPAHTGDSIDSRLKGGLLWYLRYLEIATKTPYPYPPNDDAGIAI